MKRRDVLTALGGAAFSKVFGQIQPSQSGALLGQQAADFTLHIGPVKIELAPGQTVTTLGYNGQVPGPLLRMHEGKRVTIDVLNHTSADEVVHWHGLHIPSEVDGSMEEGTPVVPAGGHRRYTFTPAPAGTRWYHTHTMAGRDLTRATYTGMFGFLYIEPKRDPVGYDREVFLALKEWNPYMSGEGDVAGTLDALYEHFSINDRALGHGEPVSVSEKQRIMFRILNASATMNRRVALAAHRFKIVAMDGNALPAPKESEVLELGPGERIDAIVEMNQPGVWIFGTIDDHDRQAGMGIIVEYAGKRGEARWLPPSNQKWNYAAFGEAKPAPIPLARIPLVFEKNGFESFPNARFRNMNTGRRWMDKWTINGKSYPSTDRIRIKKNERYRLVFDNRSDEAHPLHLHRHTFELTRVEGVPTSGIKKDVVMVNPKSQVEVDFLANNPGMTLFHCHQQMHMDNGFMTLLEYV